MTAVPIGLGLDQARPATFARSCEHLGGRFVHELDVVTVDQYGFETIGTGPVGGRVLDGGHFADGRVLHI
jgi:hypothetical protein